MELVLALRENMRAFTQGDDWIDRDVWLSCRWLKAHKNDMNLDRDGKLPNREIGKDRILRRVEEWDDGETERGMWDEGKAMNNINKSQDSRRVETRED